MCWARSAMPSTATCHSFFQIKHSMIANTGTQIKYSFICDVQPQSVEMDEPSFVYPLIMFDVKWSYICREFGHAMV